MGESQARVRFVSTLGGTRKAGGALGAVSDYKTINKSLDFNSSCVFQRDLCMCSKLSAPSVYISQKSGPWIDFFFRVLNFVFQAE